MTGMQEPDHSSVRGAVWTSQATSHRRSSSSKCFSAAVVVGSNEIEGSKRLIEFLTSARASEAIRNSGMEPLATSR